MPRKKCFSKVVEESGVSVRIFERAPGSLLYREVRDGEGAKDRKSLGHRDRALALEQARVLARRLAELRLAGHVGRLTLGQLLALYELHRVPLLSAHRQGHARLFAGYFRAHLNDAFIVEDLSQTQVDAYAAARRARTVRSKTHRGVATAPRDGTIRNELLWLRAVLRWARGFRQGGRRLLTSDPMEGVELPRELNVRRPVASPERYEKTLAQAHRSDSRGRFACMFVIARYSGRRVNAIASLHASDVLLSRDAVLRALAAAGRDEREADHMPHGALRWRGEHDKQGFNDIAPITRPVREALEAYARAHPRVGEAPLFPSTADDSKPVHRNLTNYWLKRAERLAGLPPLERGAWHPYRRAWASDRKHLPDVDVSRAGGWRDVAVMKASYQQSDAATRLRVVENVTTDPAPSTDRQAGRDAG